MVNLHDQKYFIFHKTKTGVSYWFFISASSLLFGTWVASIPGIKYRLGFTDASLGLSLLLSPLGALTGVALSTKLFGKIPVGKWMIAGYFSLGIIMILQINSVNRLMFWICLYCFGMNGFLNGVSVNTTVSYLEKKYKRRMMSTCHGMYSLGGGISAGLATVFFALQFVSAFADSVGGGNNLHRRLFQSETFTCSQSHHPFGLRYQISVFSYSKHFFSLHGSLHGRGLRGRLECHLFKGIITWGEGNYGIRIRGVLGRRLRSEDLMAIASLQNLEVKEL